MQHVRFGCQGQGRTGRTGQHQHHRTREGPLPSLAQGENHHQNKTEGKFDKCSTVSILILDHLNS